MALLVFALVMAIVPTPIVAQRSADAAVFGRVLPVLRERTRVPLRLPSYIAAESETVPLHAIVETAVRSRYEIQLAFTPDCMGGNACRHGMVSGEARGRNAPRLRGKAVRLARGVTGYFEEATCGATCSDSAMSWDEGGYRYTVAIKAESLARLRRVANSAIENPVRVRR